MKTKKTLLVLGCGLAAMALVCVEIGCDKPGAKATTDGIAQFGTTDLDYDPAPIPNPAEGLPLLTDSDPDYVAALAGQVLPDDTVEIHQLDEARSFVGYSTADDLANQLREHGIARRLSGSNGELMAEAVSAVADSWSGEPGVLLTSDAVFNTFHNFYDNLLLGVEIHTLRPRMAAMLGEVKVEAAKRYNSLPDGPTREAALDVVAYLLVAEKLIAPETSTIDQVKDVVDAELALIDSLSGPNPSPLFDRPDYSVDPCPSTCDPCNSEPSKEGCGWYEGEEVIPCPERYCEDYSQYKPRGHYTYSAELEQYFRSLMWLGRMTLLNRSDQSTRGAVILLDSLKDARTEVDGDTVAATEIWVQFFRVIGTFVGGMDDLNASEVDAAVVDAMGGGFSLTELDDDAALQTIHERIAALHDPGINSGYLNSKSELGDATKGLRLMGQVFLPDSYALWQLVFGNVGPSDTVNVQGWTEAADRCGIDPGTDPETLDMTERDCICTSAWADGEYRLPNGPFWDVCRGMPSGLDVAAVLGSQLATDLAQESFYAGYSDQLSELSTEFLGFDLESWGISVAWTWLYALEGLFADGDEGDPAFMRTAMYELKNLETGLTSWAEMRHDTVLYAKQSYTSSDSDTDGDADSDADYDFDYVEPQPEAYARLGAATRRLQALAGEEQLFGGEAADLADHVEGMASFLDRAAEIAVLELEGQQLTPSDIGWIANSGYEIGGLENSLLDSLGLYDDDEEPDPDRLKTTIIADVHTWPSKQMVLEVGSGYLDYVAVLHQLPNGEWGVAVGPAFSYHEFEHDMNDRLTDEKWRELLEGDPEHGHPDWLDW